MLLKFFLALTISFLLSTVFSLIIRNVLTKRDIIRKPSNDRWHKTSVPIFGGVAIYLSFVIGALFFAEWNTSFITFFILSSFVFSVGLIDDIIQINAPTKLVLQVVAASALVISGYYIHFFENEYINKAISLFIIVCITNSFNLLDNMDGLSAGVAVVVLFFNGLFALYNGNMEFVIISIILSGAILGFLVFNFNPASIFMGDCGSLFIGFSISSLFVIFSSTTHKSVNFQLLYVLLLAIPFFDTFFVAITRKFTGRRISEGGKDHLSHRLVKAGLTERTAVMILYGLTAITGFIAYYIYVKRDFFIAGILLVITVFTAILFARYLSRYEYNNSSNKKSNLFIVRYYRSLKYKRYILQIILDVICIVFSYYGAYLLRFGNIEISGQLEHFTFSVFIIVPSILLFNMLFGVYRGTWQYISIPDYFNIGKGVIVGSIFTIFILAFGFHYINFSRAVFFVNILILMVILPGTRASYKLFDHVFYSTKNNNKSKRVIIYGAGDAGEMLLRMIKNTKSLDRKVIGFIDDNKDRGLNSIMGISILGSLNNITDAINKYKATEILISTNKISDEKISIIKNGNKNIRILKYKIKLEEV